MDIRNVSYKAITTDGDIVTGIPMRYYDYNERIEKWVMVQSDLTYCDKGCTYLCVGLWSEIDPESVSIEIYKETIYQKGYKVSE